MSRMVYKGYSADITFDAEDLIFYGKVVDVVDRIVFSGQSVEELQSNFHLSIDTYIECCREAGGEPEKPASGRVLLRLQPDLHARVVKAAKSSGLSVNRWLVSSVEDKLTNHRQVVQFSAQKSMEVSTVQADTEWQFTATTIIPQKLPC